MAVNSLLYFLLTTGLTTSPDGPVTTEGPYDAAKWSEQTTKWPGYGEEPFDATAHWRQETRYYTEDPSHQYTAPPVTEGVDPDEAFSAEQGEILNSGGCPSQIECTKSCKRMGYKYGLCSGPDKRNCHCYRKWGADVPEPQPEAHRWPYATEEFQTEAEPLATEEPENETESPAITKKGKRKCPPREHFTKCHKNCEKTCSNHSKPVPCPRSYKKGCVCDGGLVRNKQGKCVPRDQCPKRMMSEAYESHGCPDDILCEVHCITEAGKHSGRCEGNTCKCLDKLNAGGCPNLRDCHINCQMEGHSYGLCVGSDRKNCVCYEKSGAEDSSIPKDQLPFYPFPITTGSKTDQLPFYPFPITTGGKTVDPDEIVSAEQFFPDGRYPHPYPSDFKVDPDEAVSAEQYPPLKGDQVPFFPFPITTGDKTVDPDEIVSAEQFFPDGRYPHPYPSDLKVDPDEAVSAEQYPPLKGGQDCSEPVKCGPFKSNNNEEPFPGMLRYGGCPDGNACMEYCRKKGKKVGSCQGMHHMECLCFDHW